MYDPAVRHDGIVYSYAVPATMRGVAPQTLEVPVRPVSATLNQTALIDVRTVEWV